MREIPPPCFRGHVDGIQPIFRGWVARISDPVMPVAFALHVDGHKIAEATTGLCRPDVAAAGLAGPNSGFSVVLPSDCLDGEEHRLGLVLPDGSALTLSGVPSNAVLGSMRPQIVSSAAATGTAALDLLQRTHAEAGLPPDLVSPAAATAFNQVDAPDRGFLFYARVKSRIVGYARLDRGSGSYARLGILSISILEAYRGRGIGERLMRRLLAAASLSGLSEIWLAVRPDNTSAIRLYQKLGFVRMTSSVFAAPDPDHVTMYLPAERDARTWFHKPSRLASAKRAPFEQADRRDRKAPGTTRRGVR